MSLSHNRRKKLIEMIQTDGEVRIRDLSPKRGLDRPF